MSIWFSCDNEDSLIGEGLLNSQNPDVFILADSLIHIKAETFHEDRVNAQSSTSLLGSYLDPISGQTNASFYFQITLPNNEMDFNATSVNSIELNLPYTGFFGQEDNELNVQLSKLTESINIDDGNNHYTDTVFNTEEIAGANTTISLSEIQESGTLNISFTTDFGLEEILNLDAEELNNNEAFTEAFYGFKIEVSPVISELGSIIYLNNNSSDAFLKIHYQYESMIDSASFPISDGITINSIEHNYMNPEIIENDTELFLQSMGGTYVELDFSSLRDSLDVNSQYIINEAVLSFSTIDNLDFQIPEQISLVEFNEETEDLIPIIGINSTNIGGLFSDESGEYEFNITRHIQKIINEDYNPICRLYTYNRTSNADRIMLNNSETFPIKLKLVIIKD